MADEKRLISLDEALKATHSEIYWTESQQASVRSFLVQQPKVDAVEVPDKKLLKAIKLLIKQYEHSKNSEYVHSPVAHALFHTWKQVDKELKTDK